MNNSDILFTSYAWGDIYLDYIPLYAYSIRQAYPEAGIRIFTPDEPPERVRWAISEFTDEKIVYVRDFGLTRTGKNMKVSRWLLGPEELGDWKYAYIGDIDFIILPETPSLLDYHLLHCYADNLPYSNMVREGQKRLTGLHFICTSPYFDKMGAVIDTYRKKFATKESQTRDEYHLYEMVRQSGMGFPNPGWERRYHGVHLTHARRKKTDVLQLKADQYSLYKLQFVRWEKAHRKNLSRILNHLPGLRRQVDYLKKILHENIDDLHKKL